MTLFVIMDDVRIDQMASFGDGKTRPPGMPNMDTYDLVVNSVRDGLTMSAEADVMQSNLSKTCERTYGIY